MKTLDQDLLAWAHQSVTSLGGNKDEKKKYKTAVKGAPAFIQSCGLAQAYAFWMSKNDEFGFSNLLTHLENAEGLKKLGERIRAGGIEDYSFMTQRAQLAIVFLKRMVDAYIEDEK